MQHSFKLIAVFFVAPLLVACPEEDTASLEASIEDPSLSVAEATLVTELSGSFALSLELGSYAPKATSVSLGSFALYRGSEELFSPLPLLSSEEFPLTIDVGDSRRVTLQIESDTSLSTAQAEALCSGELSFVGSVTDTLGDNKPLRIEGPPFRATCEGQ